MFLKRIQPRLLLAAEWSLVAAFLLFPVAFAPGNVAIALAFLLSLAAGDYRARWQAVRGMPVVWWALGLYAVVLVGALYSPAPGADIGMHLSKYGKLLLLPALPPLLAQAVWRTRCLNAFMAAMGFILASVYANVFWQLPWSVTQNQGWGGDHTVVGDYITQNIMMVFFATAALARGQAARGGYRWAWWLVAALAGTAVSGLIGLVALRTRGVYFLMITLAFAQMLYFVFVSLRSYGGDDGYTLMARPALGMGLDMADEATLYWVVLAIVAALLWWLDRAAGSRFGTALVGIRDNEIRMRALGYPVYLLQLTAFVVAGAIAGLAGALLATGNSFVSPSMMHWTQSATLIVMVIIGGLGRRWGGPVGAAVWLALEEALKLHTSHWHMPLGLLLIATALYAPKGLAALSDLWARSKP